MKDKQNKAFNEGLDAQTSGALKDANPYPLGSSLYDFWEMGWQNGADEDFEEDMNRE